MARKPPPRTPRPPAGTFGTRIPVASAPKKSAYPQSVHVKMTGVHDLKALRGMFLDIVHKLEAMGITHVKGGNLYLPPTDAAGNPVRPAEDKITLNGPYPVAAEEYKAP